MKANKLFGCALSLAMIATLVTPVQASETGWKVNSEGVWNYTSEEGVLAKGWKKIDNCWYEFEQNGTMKTGWVASDEKWYFLGESGIMQENAWVKSEGADYFIKGTGIMATDYIKDGYELDSTEKAIPMNQSKSVEFTENMDITNKTIEGNLYIDAAKFKELELSGITVTGKLVIIGDNSKDTTITIKDSTINTISTQAREAQVVLSGKTAVDRIQIEENSTVKADKNYTGKVETIEIQSTAKNEVKVEVAAKTVLSNTFAPVTINAPVDNLAVNKKTDLKVNADVDNVTVNKTATDTKVEVEKYVTVGSVTSDTKVEVSGPGKVEDVKGDEITNETPVPDKPAGGGSSGGGGGGGSVTPTPPVTDNNEAQIGDKKYESIHDAIKAATADQTITLLKDITLTEPIVINKKITLNGADKTISISFNNLSIVERPNTVLIISAATEVEVSNLTILVTDYLNAKLEKEWNGIYGIQVSDGASNAKLNNITVTGCDRGILVNGSTATLSGRITVTGNKKGGIEVSASEAKPEAEAKLIIATEDITNGSESKGNPTLYQGTGENVKLDGGKLSQGANDTEKKEIHFYIRAENALHELITAAIETLAENGESSYSVDADANVINATFTNGTKKISDLMGSGLFNTAIPSLIEAGVTEIKIGNDVLINQTTTANVQVLLDALAKIIADNETTTPDSSVAVNETVDILQQPLSSLNGKALSITFTYATKMNIVGFINDTYTLVFSVTTTTNPDVGGITASVESWETETIVELKN